MEHDKQLSRNADRVLKSYRNFKKLERLSKKPFSIHGGKLAKEMDRVFSSLGGLKKTILVN